VNVVEEVRSGYVAIFPLLLFVQVYVKPPPPPEACALKVAVPKTQTAVSADAVRFKGGLGMKIINVSESD
jgi:hypothetical protein